MAKEKMIQIPDKLFIELCRYFVLDIESQELKQSISKGLAEKLDRIVQHDLYTTYKTAPSKEQAEKAREEYLEKRGIPVSFRW